MSYIRFLITMLIASSSPILLASNDKQTLMSLSDINQYLESEDFIQVRHHVVDPKTQIDFEKELNRRATDLNSLGPILPLIQEMIEKGYGAGRSIEAAIAFLKDLNDEIVDNEILPDIAVKRRQIMSVLERFRRLDAETLQLKSEKITYLDNIITSEAVEPKYAVIAWLISQAMQNGTRLYQFSHTDDSLITSTRFDCWFAGAILGLTVTRQTVISQSILGHRVKKRKWRLSPFALGFGTQTKAYFFDYDCKSDMRDNDHPDLDSYDYLSKAMNSPWFKQQKFGWGTMMRGLSIFKKKEALSSDCWILDQIARAKFPTGLLAKENIPTVFSLYKQPFFELLFNSKDRKLYLAPHLRLLKSKDPQVKVVALTPSKPIQLLKAVQTHGAQ